MNDLIYYTERNSRKHDEFIKRKPSLLNQKSGHRQSSVYGPTKGSEC